MKEPDTTFGPLAINGGTPVRETSLPYGHHEIDDEDIEAVVQVLRSDWITTGPKVREFEEEIAAYVGAKYAVTFSSGTAALHGAAFAAGLEPGDEAITTPITFCATANCVLYMGATPVFADVSSDTLNLDLQQVSERITPRTKAIIPVDYAGNPVDLDGYMEIAKKNGLVIIEDAAHALGSKYKGRSVGSISHMTVFSFHPVKHITTGEGGLVATDNLDFATRLRSFRNHGIDTEVRQRQARVNGQWHYEMTELGYNYRLSDIGCALGISQLRKLQPNISRRRAIASDYKDAFADIPEVISLVEHPDSESAWHIYPVRLDLEKLDGDRSDIFHALRAENIEVNVHYIPVHLHPYYREKFGYQGGEFPVAESAYEALITLPLYHAMTQRDEADVVEAVTRVIRHYRRDI